MTNVKKIFSETVCSNGAKLGTKHLAIFVGGTELNGETL
jgi:hypothetical protein